MFPQNLEGRFVSAFQGVFGSVTPFGGVDVERFRPHEIAFFLQTVAGVIGLVADERDPAPPFFDQQLDAGLQPAQLIRKDPIDVRQIDPAVDDCDRDVA